MLLEKYIIIKMGVSKHAVTLHIYLDQIVLLSLNKNFLFI